MVRSVQANNPKSPPPHTHPASVSPLMLTHREVSSVRAAGGFVYCISLLLISNERVPDLKGQQSGVNAYQRNTVLSDIAQSTS